MSALSTGKRAVAVVCGVLMLGVAGTAIAEDGGEGSGGNTLTTTIKDAGQLEPGNEVRSSGVVVGEVADISLVDGQARIELTFNDGVLPVHDDATLTVKPVNLLGENYVEMHPGSDDAPFLEDGVISAKQVDSAVTLQDALNTFEAPTAASLASVVTALGEGVHDNGGEMAKALAALAPAMQDAERLGAILSEQNQVLADLVASADPVAAAMADSGGRTLDRLVGSTQRALSAIAVQEQALAQTLVELPGTLTSAQRTLAHVGGLTNQAVPTLRTLRPLTGDLQDVVAELKAFADAADPALASLEPVLRRAEELLDAAAPLVARLRAAGPDLRRSAASLRPLGRELLDEHLYEVMDFIRKWSLSTNGRDGISHYFRGVMYVTPRTLGQIANSVLPAGTAGTTRNQGDDGPQVGLGGAGDSLDGLLDDLGDGGDNLDGLVGGLSLRDSRSRRSGGTGALGLSTKQERRLMDQLLGGEQ